MKIINKEYTRRLFQLALPVMLTQAGQVSVNLIDNMMVGNILGEDKLASVSLANSVFFSLFVLALGVSFAMPPLISEADSQKKHNEINSIFRHGFVLNTISAVVLIILMFAAMPLLYYMNQPEHILPDTEAYLQIMTLSLLPIMVFQTLRELSEGLSFTIGVTKATIYANIINVVLNYLLIKGIWIFPEYGVLGSAISTFVARIFMIVFLYYILIKEEKTRRYIKDFHLKIGEFSQQMFNKMLKLGLPTAFQMFFEVTAFAGAAFVCGLVSATDIAAHQIALSMASFTFNLSVGFGVASTIMIGNKYADRNMIECRKIGTNTMKITFMLMLITGLIFIFGKDALPVMFAKSEEIVVKQLASQLLIIAALFQLSDGIQAVLLANLRGIQDVKIPSIITFIAYWVVAIPLGYYLCVIDQQGAWGMWIALGIGLTISALLLAFRFYKMTEKSH